MPGGRPTKYKAEYCEQVVELGREGKSPAQIAASIGDGVARQTLDEWADKHPEFSAALTRAKTLEQDWWERQAQNGSAMSVIGGAIWAKSVAARFREDYTERREDKVQVQQVGAIEVEVVKPK